MDTRLKANREAGDVTLRYRGRQNALLVNELNNDKLRQLLTFIGQLENTPAGAADLLRRINLFGECKRGDNETSDKFCARLRYWLDRDLPKKKMPFRTSWQTID